MTTALVVDDDPDLRQLMLTVLDRAGYDVWAESDGGAALASALKLRPDVVLLDWLMPVRSGIEVCQALRAEATLAHTAVIMVTARDTESDLEWGYACGADDYVVKPFLTSDLVHRVERAIAHRAAIIGTGQPTG
ncbi:MAG: response regulator [Kineosporiaceae bacterium]|nr:response regulator [Kineosporiaceae bacterium]MBK7622509.1 response regulator [Kineosporiaceae bacterium]MBK8078423.1 response regulator [Kineosporiaceae bacterium]